LLSNKKQNIFPANRTAKLSGWCGSSLVWQHFVKGKKKFSEIVKRK